MYSGDSIKTIIIKVVLFTSYNFEIWIWNFIMKLKFGVQIY